MMKTSEHPIPVTRTWFHPCKAPMLWTTWVPVISLRGLRSFFGAEGCITFFLGCPAGQDRTLLSQCRIELLAVCKTKIVRDRKLTKISKLNRPESGRAYWNENFSVWKIQDLVLIFVLEGTQVLETSLPLLGWPTSAARRASWQVADWLSRCFGWSTRVWVCFNFWFHWFPKRFLTSNCITCPTEMVCTSQTQKSCWPPQHRAGARPSPSPDELPAPPGKQKRCGSTWQILPLILEALIFNQCFTRLTQPTLQVLPQKVIFT